MRIGHTEFKWLYGCLNLKTGMLVGVTRYKAPKYAFTQYGWARRAFKEFIRFPQAYAIVRLAPSKVITDIDLGDV